MNGDQFRIYTTDLLGSTGLTSEQIDEMPFLNDDPNSITYKNTTTTPIGTMKFTSQALHKTIILA